MRDVVQRIIELLQMIGMGSGDVWSDVAEDSQGLRKVRADPVEQPAIGVPQGGVGRKQAAAQQDVAQLAELRVARRQRFGVSDAVEDEVEDLLRVLALGQADVGRRGSRLGPLGGWVVAGSRCPWGRLRRVMVAAGPRKRSQRQKIGPVGGTRRDL